ncbi:MAG: Crp/Fnr family transcriptional regulator [Bacteroidota bacterium]
MVEKTQLANYLNRFGKISNEEVDIFFGRMEKKTFSKNEFLLYYGKTCTHQYFILQGLTRTFHVDDKGNEKITQFGMENWWLTNWSSYKNNEPSKSYIQVLEPTTVLQIEKSALEESFKEITSLERIFREITENWLIAIQRRNYYLNLDSKTRYEKFISTLPHFGQRIPQYMIASYLEITPQHLSTIRAKNTS